MAIAHLLEDFGEAAMRDGIGKFMDEEAIEDLRLVAFEQGYTGGWDDSTAAQERTRTRVSEGLAQNLEDLSFSYQEALNRMILASEPVFRLMLEKVVPAGFEAAQLALMLDQIQEMIREGASGPVQISLCPSDAHAVIPLLPKVAAMPVEIVENPQLEPGMADIHVGETQRAVDGAQLVAQLTEAVEAFYHLTREATQHG